MKGDKDDEAVLCTREATYALKHVETTNALFLVPAALSQEAAAAGKGADGAITVAATANAVIELAPTAPRLGALDRILQVECMLLHFACTSAQGASIGLFVVCPLPV